MQGNAWALRGALRGEALLYSNVPMLVVEAYGGSLMEGCSVVWSLKL